MKKLFILSFLFSLLFVSQSNAQWWVQGGNLIWPYGTVTVKDSFSVGGNVSITGDLTSANISVNGSLTAADITASGNLTADNITAGSNISFATLNGVKVYRALLTQSGTDDPVPLVLENTFGSINWTRNSTGRYTASFDGYTIETSKLFINAQRMCNSITYATYVPISFIVDRTYIMLRQDLEDLNDWVGAVINYEGTNYYPVEFILYPTP